MEFLIAVKKRGRDMKTKKTNCVFRIMAVCAAMFFVAACDDGELAKTVSPSITPPPPVVITFSADPATVKSGGESTISWEVAGADSVEIKAVSTAAPLDFHVESNELSGTAKASNITATTDFVLTATKAATVPSEEEGSEGKTKNKAEDVASDSNADEAPATASSVSQTITVTVLAPTEIKAVITADKPSISAGEKVLVSWEVSPADGVTTVVAAEPTLQIDAKDAETCKTGDIAKIEAQTKLDTVPAVGCAVVSPMQKTVFTVTGTDATGGTGGASVTVDVANEELTANISAGKSEGEKKHPTLPVDSFPSIVFVSWKVSPATAKVKVEASPAITPSTGNSEAPCELPNNATDKAEAGTKCQVTTNTTFKITATLEGKQPATDEVKVEQQMAAGAAGLVIAEKWALEGEKISLKISLDDATKLQSSVVQDVLVNNAAIGSDSLTTLKKDYTITVQNIVAKPPFVTVQLKYGSAGNAVVDYKPVPVVPLVVKATDSDVAAITSMTITPDLTRLVGVRLKKSFSETKGNARLYKNGGAINFQFGNPIMEALGMKDDWHNEWNVGFFDAMGTYPVAVGVREGKPEEIFAGTSGSVMRSKDGGKSWGNIFVSRLEGSIDLTNYDHPACGRSDKGTQNVQAGVPPRFDMDFISLSQTCDILALQNGTVVLATDRGIRYKADVENPNLKWEGKPDIGQTGAASGKPTYGYVVNRLIKAGDKIFAAAENGLFVSKDSAATWQAFGTIKAPIWTLALDSRNNVLYAGNEDGVSASPVDSAAWTPIAITGPVVSLAVDPLTDDPQTQDHEVTILAGTPTGVKISRDGGKTQQDVAIASGQQPVQAVALVSQTSGNLIEYTIDIGTPAGEIFQQFPVAVQQVQQGATTQSGQAPQHRPIVVPRP